MPNPTVRRTNLELLDAAITHARTRGVLSDIVAFLHPTSPVAVHVLGPAPEEGATTRRPASAQLRV
jgi:hypothetical protein